MAKRRVVKDEATEFGKSLRSAMKAGKLPANLPTYEDAEVAVQTVEHWRGLLRRGNPLASVILTGFDLSVLAVTIMAKTDDPTPALFKHCIKLIASVVGEKQKEEDMVGGFGTFLMQKPEGIH